MPGPDRTQPASVMNRKIPRPPNAWILFRSDMNKQVSKYDDDGTRKTQATISKEISNLWQSAPPETRELYDRLAEAKKQEHQMAHPDYRFAPMKKEEKERLREQKRLEKERDSKASRKRVRASPYASSYIPSLISAHPSSAVPTDMPLSYGPCGPSPPISAASSPGESQEESSQLQYHPGSLITVPQSQSLPSFDLPEQPIAGPSNWQQQVPSDAVTWPGLPSINEPETDGQHMLQFNLPQQPWMSTDGTAEFDQSIQALITATGDPSIFQMSNFDPSELNGQALDVDLGQLLDTSQFPNMTDWDLSGLALDSNDQSFLEATPILEYSEGQTRFASDEFFDYEAAGAAVTTSSTPEPTFERAATTTPYVPPQGASQAANRRVGGTWRPFPSDEAQGPPRPYSVPV